MNLPISDYDAAAMSVDLLALLRGSKLTAAARARLELLADALSQKASPDHGSDHGGGAVVAGDLFRALPADGTPASIVPISRRLKLTPERSRALWLKAHQDGDVELRGHSSLDRLSAADEALCPRGMGDAVLSYARRRY